MAPAIPPMRLPRPGIIVPRATPPQAPPATPAVAAPAAVDQRPLSLLFVAASKSALALALAASACAKLAAD